MKIKRERGRGREGNNTITTALGNMVCTSRMSGSMAWNRDVVPQVFRMKRFSDT